MSTLKQKPHGQSLCYQYHLSSQALTNKFNHRLDPQIEFLASRDWFQKLQHDIIPSIERDTRIDNITTHTSPGVLNILDHLYQFIKSNDIPTGVDTARLSDLRKLLSRLSSQGFRQLSRVDRYNIRRMLEIDPIGSAIKNEFFAYLRKQPDLITQESELLLNPFTSIINLAEIYRQVRSHTIVNWSCGARIQGLPDALEFYSDTAEGPSKHEVIEYCQRLALFCQLLNTRKIPKHVTVYLIDYKKEFMQVKSRPDLIFTSSEINTGVCDGVSIIISRREESLKTLIHELVHFHDLDFKHDVPQLDTIVQRVTNNNVSTTQTGQSGNAIFNLGEAHTECLASIIHLLIRGRTTERFAVLFKQQVLYTLAKQAGIMRVSKCNTLTDKQCHIRESTNVFSYFFVKSYLYFNLRLWLEGCCTESLPKFKSNQQTAFEQLSKILESGSTDPLIQACVRDLSLLKTENLTKKRIDNSLRMVCAD